MVVKNMERESWKGKHYLRNLEINRRATKKRIWKITDLTICSGPI
jgi:hypothetical protein